MHRPAARARRPIPMLLALIALGVGACTTTSTPSGTAAASTGTPAPASSSPVVTLVPSDAASPAATQPGQSDTDWERIWDDVPGDFPTYPGAHPTETGEGPASQVLDAGPAAPAAIVDWYKTALAAASYKAVSDDGPREDGSYELIASGGGCDIRVTAAPLGGSTIITIMYGAGCPFP